MAIKHGSIRLVANISSLVVSPVPNGGPSGSDTPSQNAPNAAWTPSTSDPKLITNKTIMIGKNGMSFVLSTETLLFCVSQMIKGLQMKKIDRRRTVIQANDQTVARVPSCKNILKRSAMIQLKASQTMEQFVANLPRSELRMLSSAKTVVVTGNEVIALREITVWMQWETSGESSKVFFKRRTVRLPRENGKA